MSVVFPGRGIVYQLFRRAEHDESIRSRNNRTTIGKPVVAETGKIMSRRPPLYQVRQYAPHAGPDAEAVATQARTHE